MSPDTTRCAAAFRRSPTALIGTAPVASRWLLIEHPGPWARRHLETPPLAGVAAQLDAVLQHHGAKSLLVRRPGRRTPTTERAWFAVDASRGVAVTGTWTVEADLIAAADALGQTLDQADSAPDPMVLVCTQGTRDACCALRGRPVVAALVQEFGDQVWECTHLSGHRFAGTFLTMPDAVCFGAVDAPGAAAIVRSHRAGATDLAHLRGVARYSQREQAATAAVLLAHEVRNLDHVRPGTTTSTVEGNSLVEVLGVAPLPPRTWVEVWDEPVRSAPMSCGKDVESQTEVRAAIRGIDAG